MVHQNIAGLLNKQDLLYAAITDLDRDIGGIDIICLIETFLKRGTECNLKFDNYRLVSFFSRTNQRRGGAYILLKNGLEYKDVTYQIPSMPCHFECCAIEIIKFNLIVVCIYRTPTPKTEIFLRKLEIFINTLCRHGNKNIIMVETGILI